MADLRTFSDIIDTWPSIAEFARDAGCSYEAARQMRRRNSVDSGYWLRITRSAEARGIPGITLDRLAEIAAKNVEAAE